MQTYEFEDEKKAKAALKGANVGRKLQMRDKLRRENNLKSRNGVSTGMEMV
jgi:hypothetical protein